ncbi:MAG TPA: hypothetical protein VGE04_08550 [Chloroflexia bacterium]
MDASGTLAVPAQIATSGERGDAGTGKTMLLLAWGIIWRMTLWGLAAGSVLGLLYGCAIILLVGGLYGVLFGAVFGLVTGLLSGVTMAAITLATPLRTRRTSRFSRVLRVVPIGVILALAMLQVIATIASDPFGPPASGLVEFLTQAWSRVSSGGWQILIYYIPSIIATVPAWFAGKQVATWVADESWRPRQLLS